MLVLMSLHSNLGECAGQRKPILDLPGHQDISDSANLMKAWNGLIQISIIESGWYLWGRAVPRLNQKDI